MPVLLHVRNSNLNRHTYELINKGAIEALTAREVAAEYKSITLRLDELDVSLQPLLTSLESTLNDYIQIRSKYADKAYAIQNKTILNQAATASIKRISKLQTELKTKVVSFIEYAINVLRSEQDEDNLGLLQLRVHYFLNKPEIITDDPKYCRKHVNLTSLEFNTLTDLIRNVRYIADLLTILNRQPSNKRDLSAILFMFNRGDNSELFVKFDKAVPNFKKLFLNCSLNGSKGLQAYRKRMIAFSSSVAEQGHNASAQPTRSIIRYTNG